MINLLCWGRLGEGGNNQLSISICQIVKILSFALPNKKLLVNN